MVAATEAVEHQLADSWSGTLRRYDAQLDFVADQLGPLNVAALERLATALWVRQELPDASEAEQASRVNDLKPHVSIGSARASLSEVKKMEVRAAAIATEGAGV